MKTNSQLTLLDTIKAADYISFSTFRKDGREVSTPVWFAETNGRLCVFSAGDAGKVKRLRNSSTSRIAQCTATGKVIGDWVDSDAKIINSENEVNDALRALRKKYGWKMRLLDFGSRLSGKYQQRAFISITIV